MLREGYVLVWGQHSSGWKLFQQMPFSPRLIITYRLQRCEFASSALNSQRSRIALSEPGLLRLCSFLRQQQHRYQQKACASWSTLQKRYLVTKMPFASYYELNLWKWPVKILLRKQYWPHTSFVCLGWKRKVWTWYSVIVKKQSFLNSDLVFSLLSASSSSFLCLSSLLLVAEVQQAVFAPWQWWWPGFWQQQLPISHPPFSGAWGICHAPRPLIMLLFVHVLVSGPDLSSFEINGKVWWLCWVSCLVVNALGQSCCLV